MKLASADTAPGFHGAGTKIERAQCNVAIVSVQRGKRKTYSCIFAYLPQLRPEGLGDGLGSSAPLLLGHVIPCHASRCRQRKESRSNDELLPVILLTAQVDYRDIPRGGCGEERRFPLVGREPCGLPCAAPEPCRDHGSPLLRAGGHVQPHRSDTARRNSPHLLVVWSLEGKYQPRLTP